MGGGDSEPVTDSGKGRVGGRAAPWAQKGGEPGLAVEPVPSLAAWVTSPGVQQTNYINLIFKIKHLGRTGH